MLTVHYTEDKDLLERMQKVDVLQKNDSIVRTLPYKERLARTGLWTLEDRGVRADLTGVYKITHGFSFSSVSLSGSSLFWRRCDTLLIPYALPVLWMTSMTMSRHKQRVRAHF